MTPADAVRLAKQATFGPTPSLVDHIVQVGLQSWLDEQFAAKGSTYADLMARAVPRDYCDKSKGDFSICARDYLRAPPVAMRFYADALGKDDQLRQRVAWALSQLLVVSDVDTRSTAGLAAHGQLLLDNAFGNYRDLLKSVTISGVMGDYLNLADNSKKAPNENYARELMQLFSIGVVALDADGTVQKDASGAAIPAYSQNDVREIARALTGWTYSRLNGAALSEGRMADFSRPMTQVPARYDAGEKNFLGRTVPANASQEESVNTVIDAVFEHANTAPYISKFLIRQLVASNPSPGYVRRVAAVFANNGAGVRGDLKAVVRAILIDPEARGPAKSGEADGKVKEPVLLATSVARLIGVKTDGYSLTKDDNDGEQQPFESTTVFNFYQAEYPLPRGGGLASPVSQLMTTASIVARHNLIYRWTLGSGADAAPNPTVPGAIGTQSDWTGWQALRGDPDAIVDRLNLLLLNNTMSAAQKAAVKSAVAAVTDPDPASESRKRAQLGLYVVATSPQFQVDR